MHPIFGRPHYERFAVWLRGQIGILLQQSAGDMLLDQIERKLVLELGKDRVRRDQCAEAVDFWRLLGGLFDPSSAASGLRR